MGGRKAAHPSKGSTLQKFGPAGVAPDRTGCVCVNPHPMRSRMSISSKSWPRLSIATLLGLGFAAVTARVLLDDVANGGPFGVPHMMSVAALAATIASGHYLLPVLRRGAVVSAVGLAILFAAGTSYVLVAAAARNAEVQAARAGTIHLTNAERTTLRQQLTTAEGDLKTAKTELTNATALAAVECRTGLGKKCDGLGVVRDTAERARDRAESYVRILQARINLLGPEKEEAGGYAHAGRVWAALMGGSEDRATSVLILAMPIVTTLLCELATIVFLGLGFGPHRRVPVPVETLKPEPGPVKRTRKTKHKEVADFAKAFEARHGRKPGWSETRAAGFSAATASRGLRQAR